MVAARVSGKGRPCRPVRSRSRLLRPAAVTNAVLLGLPAEVDTALAVGRRKSRSLGQPAETDAALPIVGRKTRALGQATEADTALAVGRRKSRALGEPAEADTALHVAGRKARLLGQPAETDVALHVGGRKSLALGQPSEVDLALPLVLPVLSGYLFSPPSQTELIAAPFAGYPPGAGPRVRIREGLCVFRIAGTWYASAGPTHLDVAAADQFFTGGHIHTIPVDIAIELLLAGFGAGLVPIH